MPRKFTDQEKDQIKSQAIEFWDNSSESQNVFFKNVNTWERAWRAMLPEDLETAYAAKPDRAALAPPDFYININSLRASLKSLLFGSKPYATLTKEGQPNLRDEEVIKAEQVLQSMLDIQNNGRGHPSEASKIILQALYAGVSGCFTNWKTVTKPVPVRGPDGQVLLGEDGYTVYQNQVVAEYAETVGIDIRRLRVDPSADKRENIRIMGYQALSKVSELIKLNRIPDNGFDFDEKELLTSSFTREQYYEYIKEEVANQSQDDGQTYSDKNTEIWHIRGLFRFDNDDGSVDFRDLIVTIGNRHLLLQVQENALPIPGWELFDLPAVDQELSRLFTMGVVEPAFDLWIEKFIKRNQSLDESSRRTYQKYIGDKSACQELGDNIENEDGIILQVDLASSNSTSVHEVLQPLPEPRTGHDTFTQADALSGDIQRTMRVNDYLGGQDPQRKETATGVSALVSGGATQLSDMAEHIRDTFLAPIYRKQLVLWQFFKGGRDQEVVDGQGQQLRVRANELKSFYNVDIDIATALDKPEMMRRMVEVFPVIKDDPFYKPHVVRQTMNRILKLPNAEQILLPDEQLQTKIDNENISLAAGVVQQVSSHDIHGKHLEGHMAFFEQAQPEGDIADEELFEQHVQEHQQYIEQAQGGLGNSKDLGGNSGQQITPGFGAIKPKGQSGRGLPQGSRA